MSLHAFIQKCQNDRLVNLQLGMAKNLVTLLLSKNQMHLQVREGFALAESPMTWSLVVKSLLDMKASALVEHDIFGTLVNAFLTASQEVQQSLFSEILQVSQNLISQNTHQICSEILAIVFTLLVQN